MKQVAGLTLDTTVLDALIAQAEPKAEKIVRAAALQIAGAAQTLAPVDTGALKNSLHAEDAGRLTWIVADGVEYGIYQELGTRKMAAHPFLVPAVEKTRARWAQMWKDFFNGRSTV